MGRVLCGLPQTPLLYCGQAIAISLGVEWSAAPVLQPSLDIQWDQPAGIRHPGPERRCHAADYTLADYLKGTFYEFTRRYDLIC